MREQSTHAQRLDKSRRNTPFTVKGRVKFPRDHRHGRGQSLRRRTFAALDDVEVAQLPTGHLAVAAGASTGNRRRSGCTSCDARENRLPARHRGSTHAPRSKAVRLSQAFGPSPDLPGAIRAPTSTKNGTSNTPSWPMKRMALPLLHQSFCCGLRNASVMAATPLILERFPAVVGSESAPVPTSVIATVERQHGIGCVPAN